MRISHLSFNLNNSGGANEKKGQPFFFRSDARINIALFANFYLQRANFYHVPHSPAATSPHTTTTSCVYRILRNKRFYESAHCTRATFSVATFLLWIA